jgi:hypothetical protein
VSPLKRAPPCPLELVHDDHSRQARDHSRESSSTKTLSPCAYWLHVGVGWMLLQSSRNAALCSVTIYSVSLDMGFPRVRWTILFLVLASSALVAAQSSARPSSSSSKHSKASLPRPKPEIAAGSVTDGVYRNTTLGLSCKIPPGWVLRTDEMNRTDEATSESASETNARVLLAAFSRPPDAQGEEINASILIAAEPQSSYPGLKDAAQYFGPLTEVAKAQGFAVNEEPYEFAVGSKTLVRGDFQKDVGSRIMRQSTLAFLAHGSAVSITLIAGTEDELENLIAGVTFTASATAPHSAK